MFDSVLVFNTEKSFKKFELHFVECGVVFQFASEAGSPWLALLLAVEGKNHDGSIWSECARETRRNRTSAETV